MHLKCNYCEGEKWGSIFRMKNHLAGTYYNVFVCEQCLEEVRNFFLNMLGAKRKKYDDFVEILEMEEQTN